MIDQLVDYNPQTELLSHGGTDPFDKLSGDHGTELTTAWNGTLGLGVIVVSPLPSDINFC